MKNYYNFTQAMNLLERTEPTELIWSGVKKNSFGLIFGPSKSGKTIFCENLAMAFAVGKDEFMGYPINSEPQKVLFVGLEEILRNRLERNFKQYSTFNEEEKNMFENNFIVPDENFPRSITSNENWDLLTMTIVNSEAKVVFIDSITRLNHGKIEDSKTAEEICFKLRNISQDLNVTLFVIHHTPKLGEDEISMDKIKGSTVFAQESDFAFGINRNRRNVRYMKNIFFRYADDSDDSLHEFSLDENLVVNPLKVKSVDEYRMSYDRRISDKRDLIVDFFDSNPSCTYSTNELVQIINEKYEIKDRQTKEYLSELVNSKKILNIKRGLYSSMKYEGGGNIE